MRLLLLGAISALVLGFCHAPVYGQSPDQQVEKGLSEFQDLEFAQAISTLEVVLQTSQSTPSQRILALELIAISHLSLGRSKKAEAAFERLLTLRPDYQLRNHDGSPKVSAVFEAVRRRRSKVSSQEPEPEDVKPLVLGWQDFAEAKAGKRFEILVEATGTAPTSMRLFWRAGVDAEFREEAMRRQKGRQWRARIRLPKSPNDYQLAFFVEAEGPAGEVVARLGNAASVTRHPVSGRKMPTGTQGGAWYGSWKLWAGIGAATLLGGSVAVLSSGSDLREGNLSPGRITLSP